MIDAACAMVPDSCSGRGSAWHAVAVVDGVTYEAKSRSSVVAALCRELVARGVIDGPMQITFDGVAGVMTIRSIYKFAGTATTEGDGPIHRVKWHPHFAFSPAVPAARDEAGMGSTVSPVHREPPEERVAAAAPELSVTRVCKVCGGPVISKRTDATLCGPACKQKAYRQREAA
jgi:hypothetical protein